MKAWHFTNDTLRDGRPIPADGVKLIHNDSLRMCESGFHASKRIIDALKYAPGSIVHRVRLGGTMIHECDKTVAVERTILWRVDAQTLLADFARECALDVIHLWGPPAIVVEYLNSGKEDIRDAACAAAGDAAWAAAGDAARDAARAAAWAAAPAAARAAAGDAAWPAARAAARAKQNRRLTALVLKAERRAEK